MFGQIYCISFRGSCSIYRKMDGQIVKFYVINISFIEDWRLWSMFWNPSSPLTHCPWFSNDGPEKRKSTIRIQWQNSETEFYWNSSVNCIFEFSHRSCLLPFSCPPRMPACNIAGHLAIFRSFVLVPCQYTVLDSLVQALNPFLPITGQIWPV